MGKRRNISGRKHAKKFNRTNKKHRAINSPGFSMRGGIRL